MNSTSSMLDIISSIKNNDYEEKKKLQEQRFEIINAAVFNNCGIRSTLIKEVSNDKSTD